MRFENGPSLYALLPIESITFRSVDLQLCWIQESQVFLPSTFVFSSRIGLHRGDDDIDRQGCR
jgi:hypothetical protein